MDQKTKFTKVVTPVVLFLSLMIVLSLDQLTFSPVYKATAYPSPGYLYLLLDFGIDILLALTILLLFWYLVNVSATYLAGMLVLIGFILVALRLLSPYITGLGSIVFSTCRISVIGYFLIVSGVLSILLANIKRNSKKRFLDIES